MSAFVTGATGFIGKRLVRRLLQRDNEPVYILVYKPTPELIAGLKEFWGAEAESRDAHRRRHLEVRSRRLGQGRAQAQRQDRPFLPSRRRLRPRRPSRRKSSTRTSRAWPTRSLSPRRSRRAASITCSSIAAAAGLYDGVFREDMFEEARGLRASVLFLEAQGRGPRARRDRRFRGGSIGPGLSLATRRPARSTRSTAPIISSS